MGRNEIIKVVQQNISDGKDNRYDGLTGSEIGEYNRYLMYGDMTDEEALDCMNSSLVY